MQKYQEEKNELKRLTEANLVIRKNFGEIPPKVEYELTSIGQKAIPLITEMKNFAIEYEAEIKGNT